LTGWLTKTNRENINVKYNIIKYVIKNNLTLHYNMQVLVLHTMTKISGNIKKFQRRTKTWKADMIEGFNC
jgi:ribosomal protein L23